MEAAFLRTFPVCGVSGHFADPLPEGLAPVLARLSTGLASSLVGEGSGSCQRKMLFEIPCDRSTLLCVTWYCVSPTGFSFFLANLDMKPCWGVFNDACCCCCCCCDGCCFLAVPDEGGGCEADRASRLEFEESMLQQQQQHASVTARAASICLSLCGLCTPLSIDRVRRKHRLLSLRLTAVRA